MLIKSRAYHVINPNLIVIILDIINQFQNHDLNSTIILSKLLTKGVTTITEVDLKKILSIFI